MYSLLFPIACRYTITQLTAIHFRPKKATVYAYTVSLITCDSRPARLTSSITHTGHPVTFIGHNAAFTACVHTVSAVMSKSALLNKICSISIITVKLKKNENSHFKLTVYYPIVKGVVYHGCFYPTKVILRYIYSPC